MKQQYWVLTTLAMALIILQSCNGAKKLRKEFELFQTGLDSMANYSYKDLVLKERDEITIQVFTTATSDQSQTALFNILGGKGGTYVINSAGYIELPKLGAYKVAGLTCKQLKENLLKEWSAYIKDIVVAVQLNNITINVMGEVGKQGVQKLAGEKVTILDALAESGGLREDAQRSLLVIREDSGKRVYHKIDLRDTKFYESPVFQLQQNDLIYVYASDHKYKQMQNAEFRQTIQPIFQTVNFAFSFINTILVLFALRR